MIELDSSIFPSQADAESFALRNRKLIAEAATRKYHEDGAFPVYEDFSTTLQHQLLALTSADLAQVV